MPITRHNKKQSERGSALLFALGLLAIFSALGALYIREMTLELEATNYHLSQVRARTTAQAGVNAAIAELEIAVREGNVWDLVGRSKTYDFPLYRQMHNGLSTELQVDDARRARASVVISDESGKININHSNPTVLARALGVDEATAKRIRGAMPRGNAELDAKNGRRWFAELEDLHMSGFLTQEQYANIDRSLVTTYTVSDHSNPNSHLNLNTAPVGVLEILFNLSREEAEKLASMRPFQDFKTVTDALGKDPAGFNFSINSENPEQLPKMFRLESQCFRLKCEAYEAKLMKEHEAQKVSSYAEALALFEDGGTWRILSWSARRGVDDYI